MFPSLVLSYITVSSYQKILLFILVLDICFTKQNIMELFQL